MSCEAALRRDLLAFEGRLLDSLTTGEPDPSLNEDVISLRHRLYSAAENGQLSNNVAQIANSIFRKTKGLSAFQAQAFDGFERIKNRFSGEVDFACGRNGRCSLQNRSPLSPISRPDKEAQNSATGRTSQPASLYKNCELYQDNAVDFTPCIAYYRCHMWNPYPSETDTAVLAQLCKTPGNRVTQWFAEERRELGFTVLETAATTIRRLPAQCGEARDGIARRAHYIYSTRVKSRFGAPVPQEPIDSLARKYILAGYQTTESRIPNLKARPEDSASDSVSFSPARLSIPSTRRRSISPRPLKSLQVELSARSSSPSDLESIFSQDPGRTVGRTNYCQIVADKRRASVPNSGLATRNILPRMAAGAGDDLPSPTNTDSEVGSPFYRSPSPSFRHSISPTGRVNYSLRSPSPGPASRSLYGQTGFGHEAISGRHTSLKEASVYEATPRQVAGSSGAYGSSRTPTSSGSRGYPPRFGVSEGQDF